MNEGKNRNAGDEKILKFDQEFKLNKNDEVLFFFQRLRDEAHRFAVQSTKAKHQKSFKNSLFDEITGIGRKTKNLFKSNMNINVTEQTTTFPCPVDKLKGQLFDNIGMKWQTEHGQLDITPRTIDWIMKNVKVSMFNLCVFVITKLGIVTKPRYDSVIWVSGKSYLILIIV